MSTGATTNFQIPLFGDADFVTPIQTPLNSQSNALDAALTKSAFLPYPTLAALNLVPGTIVGQHATVNADTTASNNGDYVWSGAAWLVNFPILPYGFICSASGSQSVSTGWTLMTGFGTPDLSRGITQASGVMTISQPGIYDVAASISCGASGTPTTGTQSFQVTKNSATPDANLVLKVQQSGTTAYGAKPTLLAAGDQLRWFAAAPGTGLVGLATSFISVTFKTAR